MKLLSILMTSLLLSSGAYAKKSDKKEVEKNTETHSTESHPHHNHHLGLFSGVTVEHETDYTMGLDYEYLPTSWNGKFGLALVSDFIFAHDVHALFIGGAAWHPFEHFKFFVGGGIEFSNPHNYSVLRLSTSYGFDLGNSFSLAPTASVDFVAHHTAAGVFGLTLGYGF